MIKTIISAVLLTLFSVNLAHAKPKTVIIGATITQAYVIEVVTMPGYVGEKGMAMAIVKPTENFKWNKEYPASFEIMHYESVAATPLKKEANFKEGKLCIPYIGVLARRAPIVATINFSVCNKKECLIFRNEQIILSLIVLKKNSK